MDGVFVMWHYKIDETDSGFVFKNGHHTPELKLILR